MHMTVISKVDSTYVIPICAQSTIIWYMVFLSAGLSTVGSLFQYVWMTLMHSSLIVIKGYFP
jgi:hypothetical protein